MKTKTAIASFTIQEIITALSRTYPDRLLAGGFPNRETTLGLHSAFTNIFGNQILTISADIPVEEGKNGK